MFDLRLIFHESRGRAGAHPYRSVNDAGLQICRRYAAFLGFAHFQMWVPYPRKSASIRGCCLPFASLADEAKGGDGAKSALRAIFARR
jgi:hypothetical protein